MHVALGSLSYRAAELGASPGTIGVIQGVADLVYFTIALTLPRLTDPWSRVKAVRLAAVAMASGAVLCWHAASLVPFVVALSILRGGSALFWPTLEARLSDEHFADLGRAVSAFSLSWSLGKTLGYGVNAVLFAQGLPWRGSFVITAVGSLMLLLAAPRDHDRPPEGDFEAGRIPVAPRKRVVAAWVAVFLVCGAFVVLQNQNGPLMAAKGRTGGFGNLMLAVLVAFQMLMFEALRRRPDLAGSDRALVASIGLLVTGLAAIFFGAHQAILLPAVALIGAGMGLAYTQSLFLSLRLPHRKSVAAGIHEAFIGIANASVAPLAGLATESYGDANGSVLLALLLLAAGGLFVLGCLRGGGARRGAPSS